MTDRINALTVVLEKDTREDCVGNVLSAIKQLRGVLSVTPNVADVVSHVAEERAIDLWRGRIVDLLWAKKAES
jgi:hypothetical protein